jgi:hypothetical protein
MMPTAPRLSRGDPSSSAYRQTSPRQTRLPPSAFAGDPPSQGDEAALAESAEVVAKLTLPWEPVAT